MNPNTSEVFDVADKTPFHLRATQTGSYPSLTPEYRLDKDSILMPLLGYAGTAGMQMTASDTDYTPIDSRWSQNTEAAIYILTAKSDAATGACADYAGITYTVTGHAETIASHSGGGTSTGTGSANAGVTLFITTTGTIAAPELVTVVGTKSGCTVATTGWTSSGIATTQTLRADRGHRLRAPAR